MIVWVCDGLVIFVYCRCVYFGLLCKLVNFMWFFVNVVYDYSSIEFCE